MIPVRENRSLAGRRFRGRRMEGSFGAGILKRRVRMKIPAEGAGRGLRLVRVKDLKR